MHLYRTALLQPRLLGRTGPSAWKPGARQYDMNPTVKHKCKVCDNIRNFHYFP